MCLPQACRGLNIRNTEMWNKALIMKLLWAIVHKKDHLWVRWMHAYYIKQQDVLNCSIPITGVVECKEDSKNVLYCSGLGWQ